MLQINNLTKSYNKKVAVDALTLTVEDGDLFGFIGHNGAGKTTAIKCAVGIMEFDSGDVFINGNSIKTESIAAKSLTAYVPDNPDLYDYLTGIQYLNFVADIFGVDKVERSALIGKFASAFELAPSLGDLISSYSHGMKQKVAIIGALIHKPKLLVLDEPFVGLDPKAALTLKNIMREMCKNGSSIFFSTHVLEVAEKLCNKIAIIKNGKIVVNGETAKLTEGKTLESVFMEVYGEVK